MKNIRKIFLGFIISDVMLLCFCSMPSDVEPAQWRMLMEIPITTERIELRELIEDEELFGDMELNFGEDDSSGDTVRLRKDGSEEYYVERELVVIETSMVEETLGPRTLENTPRVDVLFEYPQELTNQINEMLIGDLPEITYEMEPQVHVEKFEDIRFLRFDESSPPLPATIQNESDADLTDIKITLESDGKAIGTVLSDYLAANEAMTTSIPIKEKTLCDSLIITVEATILADSAPKEGDGLQISLAMDGLIVSEAEVIDSMVDYQEPFAGSFGISDSFRLKSIDLDDAILRCELKNPSMLKFEIKGIIENAWNRQYAQEMVLDSVMQLDKSDLDSSEFAGDLLSDTICGSNWEKDFYLKTMRVFPKWDSDSGKSLVSYRYTVKSIAEGNFVRFHKDSAIVFKLIPVKFPFMRARGSFTQAMNEQFSSQQVIGFDWEASITDSLRKAFRFGAADMKMELVPNFPSGSSLDQLWISVGLKEKNKTDTLAGFDSLLYRISADSIKTINVAVDELLNAWADTIEFEGELSLPALSDMVLYNSKDAYGNYSDKLRIGMNVKWSLDVPLSWEIIDTIGMELDRSSFDMDEGFDWANKIENRRLKIDLDILNGTNLNLVVHALAASKEHKEELDSYPRSLLGKWGPMSQWPNLFLLFEYDGLKIAPRNQKSSSTVLLDKKGMDAVLSGDSCYIRWFLMMPKNELDAMKSDDYIDLNVTAVIEGVGRTDSLLYWEN